MVRGVLSQLKNLEEENRDLKDQVQLLGGKMSKLEDANLALQEAERNLREEFQKHLKEISKANCKTCGEQKYIIYYFYNLAVTEREKGSVGRYILSFKL